MNRRQMLMGCTIVIACIYAVVFYAVFSSDHDESESVLLQNDNTESIETLYWLQAGVFKEKSSYEMLEKQLSNAGFEVYCIPKGDVTVVLIEPETDPTELNLRKNDAEQAGYEVIEKQASLSESQSSLLLDGQVSKVLQELINS